MALDGNQKIVFVIGTVQALIRIMDHIFLDYLFLEVLMKLGVITPPHNFITAITSLKVNFDNRNV